MRGMCSLRELCSLTEAFPRYQGTQSSQGTGEDSKDKETGEKQYELLLYQNSNYLLRLAKMKFKLYKTNLWLF